MASVIVDITMTLDGFIAGPNDEVEPQIMDWLFSGSTPSAYSDYFRLSPASAKVFDELVSTTGAIITGRRTYDLASGWNGSHPVNNAVFVVSHTIPKDIPVGSTTFTFVTDGIVSAVTQAKRAAGEKNVYVMGGAQVIQQAIKAGLVDSLMIHIVPLLLGKGIRLFEHLGAEWIELEQTSVVAASGVTHLLFRVPKP